MILLLLLFIRTYAVAGFGEAGCPLGVSPNNSFSPHPGGEAAGVRRK
jgi:hypothetical protein